MVTPPASRISATHRGLPLASCATVTETLSTARAACHAFHDSGTVYSAAPSGSRKRTVKVCSGSGSAAAIA